VESGGTFEVKAKKVETKKRIREEESQWEVKLRQRLED